MFFHPLTRAADLPFKAHPQREKGPFCLARAFGGDGKRALAGLEITCRSGQIHEDFVTPPAPLSLHLHPGLLCCGSPGSPPDWDLSNKRKRAEMSCGGPRGRSRGCGCRTNTLLRAAAPLAALALNQARWSCTGTPRTGFSRKSSAGREQAVLREYGLCPR